jgi:hypothetical protein
VLIMVTIALGCLMGFTLGYGMCQSRMDLLMSELQSRFDEKVNLLVEMQKLGYTPLPSEEGSVYAIDNDYELEVERERQASRTIDINAQR